MRISDFSGALERIKIKLLFCTHVTSSPGHQRENGRAEAAVKSAKYMLRKTASENTDQYLALLEMRNTPR